MPRLHEGEAQRRRALQHATRLPCTATPKTLVMPDPKPVNTTAETARATAIVDAVWTSEADIAQTLEAGTRLGPYRLKSRLGKGGMGVVWLAEQLEPIHRQVALKLIPPEQRNALSEAYFEVERQALAQLSHPAVASMYEAGRLPGGALYFAMEYVDGAPLDAYLRAHPLSIQRLGLLMQQICLGVQHAHQRGLIHRDLKPLNILVQTVDGEAQPKIIDFGIALSVRPGEVNHDRHVVGTANFMSPEQRNPSQDGVDARADVYALGAVLALLLCEYAQVPLSIRARSDSLRQGLQESLDRRHASDSNSGAQDMGIAPALLRAHLKRAPAELRAIAAMALATDREQRYSSAAAMAEDLGHWLQHQPVRAYGPKPGYALRCFVRRNRVASVAAVLIAAALCVGVLLALHGMQQAQAARAVAEQRRDDAEQLVQFMLGDFADKLRPINRLDLLDGIGQAALEYVRKQGDAADVPAALRRARALRTLGEVQVTRQQFALAEATLAQAAQALSSWQQPVQGLAADLYFEVGNIAFWRGAIHYRQLDLAATEQYWQQYLAAIEAMQTAAPNDARVPTELASALNNLGTLAEARDQLPQALAFFQRAAALRRAQITGPNDPANMHLANSLSWIARMQNALGQPRAALAALDEAVAGIERMRATEDSNLLLQRETTLRYSLGLNLRFLARDADAITQLQLALALAQRDVENDPSQPRRRLMLARIAFELARSTGIAPAQAAQALAVGSAIWVDTDQPLLSAAERASIEALRCLARGATAAVATACAATTVTALLATTTEQDLDLPVLDVLTSLAILADRAALLPPAQRLQVQSLVMTHAAAAEALQGLLVKANWLAHTGSAPEVLTDLREQIAAQRAQ